MVDRRARENMFLHQNKAVIDDLISRGHGIFAMAQIFKISETTLARWFRNAGISYPSERGVIKPKIHLGTNRTQHQTSYLGYYVETGELRKCTVCSEEKEATEFYFRNKKAGKLNSHCKDCSNKASSGFKKNAKILAVEMKGGSCMVCGYSKCVEAMEFHHRDPTKKDFNFSKNMNTINQKVLAELEKCVLLCCRCHREIHYGHVDLEYYDNSL